MRARVLYIPGRGIRWAEHEAPHVGTEMHMEAPPTSRGGRPVTVNVTFADGTTTSYFYAECLACERTAGPTEKRV